jgi:hypothetical protein
MAFINTNTVRFGNESVDTKFSALVEPNLFPLQIFQPNITFTDKYQTDAMGQLFVRKLGVGSVDRTTSLTFTHNQTADELIPIVLDKPFKQSEAIYEAVDKARTSGTGVQKFEVVMESVKKEWQQEAHDQLVAGGTASANTTAIADDPVAVGGLKKVFIGVRKELRDNDANPDVCIASTNTYAKFLDYSGKEYIPNSNDEVLRTGAVGRYLGANVFESTQLSDDGAAGSTEFLLYDHEAYSILTSLIAARIIDAGKDWVGSAAQVHLISGFKVTTPARVYKKTVTV